MNTYMPFAHVSALFASLLLSSSTFFIDIETEAKKRSYQASRWRTQGLNPGSLDFMLCAVSEAGSLEVWTPVSADVWGVDIGDSEEWAEFRRCLGAGSAGHWMGLGEGMRKFQV